MGSPNEFEWLAEVNVTLIQESPRFQTRSRKINAYRKTKDTPTVSRGGDKSGVLLIK